MVHSITNVLTHIPVAQIWHFYGKYGVRGEPIEIFRKVDDMFHDALH